VIQRLIGSSRPRAEDGRQRARGDRPEWLRRTREIGEGEMALKNYGVLVGRAVDRRLATSSNPHYQVHLIDDDLDYRIAVNVQSKLPPSEVAFLIADNFAHPILDQLASLPVGFHARPRTPQGGGLDYIRGNLFDWRQMRPLPMDAAGDDNDLNEKINHYVQRALADESATLYAFGERWGPEARKDKIFGFKPNQGIHDIHMNQGNPRDGQFAGDNGVWQDGGLLFHFPGQVQWVAVFLKFQSQSLHTDDQTGHPLTPPVPIEPGEPPVQPPPEQPDWGARILAALVNDTRSPEVETVTLLNPSPLTLDLRGWSLADKNKHRHPLAGTIPPGEALRVRIAKPMELSNKGGIITLLDEEGLKVHGVAYTKAQAQQPGWTIVFDR
jgi:uncharacterized protein YukJ